MVGVMEDRLEPLSEARLWAMSPEQVVAGLDEAHAVLVQAQAVFLRYVRQVDLHRAASKASAARVTPEVVRRMACEARICPIVFDGASQPLDLGRTRRLVSGSIRTALVARDRGCAFPSCDRDARWAEGHHVIHWSLGGPTCPDNLVLLCGHHHAEIHKAGGWTVFIASDGFPTFVPPPQWTRTGNPAATGTTGGSEARRPGSFPRRAAQDQQFGRR